jgi:hypothetical protein
MVRVGVYDQIKSAFQDIIAPELHALRARLDGVDTRIESLQAQMMSMKNELLSEIRRLDPRTPRGARSPSHPLTRLVQ